MPTPIQTAVENALGALVASMPANDAEVADKWADVAEAFFGALVNPVWTDPGKVVGRAAFKVAFVGCPPVAGFTNAGLTGVTAGFVAWAACGTVPANTTGIPVVLLPTGPLDLSSAIATVALLDPLPSDHKPAATAISNALVTWACTGLTGTPAAPTPWA